MIKAFKNNILVKALPSDSISTGGIFIPNSVQEESDKVEIISTGEGTKDKPMFFKKGMIGHRIHKWGNEIVIDNEKCYMMEQDAILAIEE